MFSLLSNLIGGTFITKAIMVILLIGMVLAVGSCSYKEVTLTHQISTLSAENAGLTRDVGTLKANQTALEQANSTDQDTIKKLILERADAQTALNTLAAQKQASQSKLASANTRIDEMLKNPQNNGTVAPVLRETLRQYMEKK